MFSKGPIPGNSPKEDTLEIIPEAYCKKKTVIGGITGYVVYYKDNPISKFLVQDHLLKHGKKLIYGLWRIVMDNFLQFLALAVVFYIVGYNHGAIRLFKRKE